MAKREQINSGRPSTSSKPSALAVSIISKPKPKPGSSDRPSVSASQPSRTVSYLRPQEKSKSTSKTRHEPDVNSNIETCDLNAKSVSASDNKSSDKPSVKPKPSTLVVPIISKPKPKPGSSDRPLVSSSQPSSTVSYLRPQEKSKSTSKTRHEPDVNSNMETCDLNAKSVSTSDNKSSDKPSVRSKPSTLVVPIISKPKPGSSDRPSVSASQPSTSSNLSRSPIPTKSLFKPGSSQMPSTSSGQPSRPLSTVVKKRVVERHPKGAGLEDDKAELGYRSEDSKEINFWKMMKSFPCCCTLRPPGRMRREALTQYHQKQQKLKQSALRDALLEKAQRRHECTLTAAEQQFVFRRIQGLAVREFMAEVAALNKAKIQEEKEEDKKRKKKKKKSRLRILTNRVRNYFMRKLGTPRPRFKRNPESKSLSLPLTKIKERKNQDLGEELFSDADCEEIVSDSGENIKNYRENLSNYKKGLANLKEDPTDSGQDDLDRIELFTNPEEDISSLSEDEVQQALKVFKYNNKDDRIDREDGTTEVSVTKIIRNVFGCSKFKQKETNL